MRHNNNKNCLKNLEPLVQPLDQKLKDLDKEKQNFHDKHAEQDLMLYASGIGQIWNSMNPKPQNTSRFFLDFRSEIMQLKASAAPPNFTKKY